MPRRRTRRRSRTWLGVSGFVLLLLLLAWQGLPALVQNRAMRALDEAGLGPAHFTLAWNGPLALATGPLQLGPSGALTADGAEISFSPRGLAAGRIDTLRLTGLHLAAKIDASGHVALADVPDLMASGQSQPSALPVDHIILEAARLDADTPAGPVTLGLDATFISTPAGLSLASRLAITFGATRLDLPDLALTAETGGWHLTAAHGTAEDSAHDIALGGIAFDLDWKGGASLLTAEIGQVQDRSKPARFPPVAAKLAARGTASRIDFTLDSADDKARVKLNASGRHDLATGRGSARISGTVQPFHAHGLQPRDLSPAFAKDLPPIDGRIGLGGTVEWIGTRIAPHLSFTLADLAGSFGAVSMSDGRGALQLDSLQPPTTPPGQIFAASLSLGDTDPMPLDLRFQLRRDGTLAIESLSLGLAEGTLRTGDLLVKPAAGLPPDMAVPVQVTGVELGALLRLVAIDGLSGEGKLDGALPLQLAEGTGGARHMMLQQGRLAARGPGILRYVGGGLPAQAGAGTQSVALLRHVLEDFHYRSLAAELDQSADGSGGVLLHLDGSNPAVLNGRRFLLNIRLDANFDRLAQLFLSGLEAAQDLTRNSLAPRR